MSSVQDVETAQQVPPPYPAEKVEFKSVWDQTTNANERTRAMPQSQPVNKCLIIFSLICCTLFGRLAVSYNNEAVGYYNSRLNEAGDEAAKKARMFTWLGIIIGTIVTLLVLGALAGIIFWQVT